MSQPCWRHTGKNWVCRSRAGLEKSPGSSYSSKIPGSGSANVPVCVQQAECQLGALQPAQGAPFLCFKAVLIMEMTFKSSWLVKNEVTHSKYAAQAPEQGTEPTPSPQICKVLTQTWGAQLQGGLECVPPPTLGPGCKIKVRNLKGIAQNGLSLGGTFQAGQGVLMLLQGGFGGQTRGWRGLAQLLRADPAGRAPGVQSQILILLHFCSICDFPKQRPVKLRPGGKRWRGKSHSSRSK